MPHPVRMKIPDCQDCECPSCGSNDFEFTEPLTDESMVTCNACFMEIPIEDIKMLMKEDMVEAVKNEVDKLLRKGKT